MTISKFDSLTINILVKKSGVILMLTSYFLLIFSLQRTLKNIINANRTFLLKVKAIYIQI